jgi:hypothetical protein
MVMPTKALPALTNPFALNMPQQHLILNWDHIATLPYAITVSQEDNIETFHFKN